MFAQPLLAGDAVVVATERDSLYRLDAATGAVRWRVSLGTPVRGAGLPCGNLDPVGITGTPVLDPATSTVWAAGFVAPGRTMLAGVDLATGGVRVERSVEPAGADPLALGQRAALALVGGRVYVAFGGRFGDCGRYHGTIVSAPATGDLGGPVTTWVAPTVNEGGIWAPPGPVLSPDGTLLVALGNTSSRGRFDDADAVVRLAPPSLSPVDLFAPTDWAALNASDADLGSTSPTPVGTWVLQVGKTGEGFLLDGAHLGGIGGQRFSARVCAGAYGATATAGSVVYVPCSDGVAAVRASGARFDRLWLARVGFAGPPVLTGSVVWVLTWSGALVGLDASTGAVLTRMPVGAVPHFPPLAAGPGRLVVATLDGVRAFDG